MTLDTLVQLGLPCTGLPAIFLVSRKNKWGFVFGLAGQPFWFTMAIRHSLWGLLFLNCGYALSWAYGFYNWWMKPKVTQPIV